MKLVPFILTKKITNKFTYFSLNVFLAHAGRSVWKTEEPGVLSEKVILSEYCEPNGIAVSKVFLDSSSNTAYLQVDTDKTNLSEFYTWDEAVVLQNKPECWRRFYFMKDKDGSSWWSPQGLIEAELQEYGNVEQLFHTIQEAF